MLVFTQYWNWFPYINFIGLSLSPSMFIGVTANLKIPTNFQLLSNCKPSLFDYPPNIPKQEKKKDDKKETAKELSTTNKARARQLRKKESDMDIEVPNQAVRTPSLISTVKEPVEADKAPKEEKPVEVTIILFRKKKKSPPLPLSTTQSVSPKNRNNTSASSKEDTHPYSPPGRSASAS